MAWHHQVGHLVISKPSTLPEQMCKQASGGDSQTVPLQVQRTLQVASRQLQGHIAHGRTWAQLDAFNPTPATRILFLHMSYFT